jgi:hypothetical protein
VLFMVAFPPLIPEWTWSAILVLAVIEIMGFSLLAGFWLPPRYGRWALRGLAGLVFLAYTLYVVDELLISVHAVSPAEPRRGSSPLKAFGGFMAIGLPCLWYAALGRFTRQPKVPQE